MRERHTIGTRAQGLALVLLGAMLGACAHQAPALVRPESAPMAVATVPASASASLPASVPAGFTILQINDVYKLEGLKGGTLGGLARVRKLRATIEATGRHVLLLHAGDFLFPSVMSKYMLGEPMIDVLNQLDGDLARRDPRMFVVFGNHEFDNADPGIVLGRVAQSDFTWLASTLQYKSGGVACSEPFANRVPNVAPYAIVELDGIRAGLVGLTLDDQSQTWLDYGFAPPHRDTALRAALDSLIAADVDVTIAVTHQNFSQDCALARAYPELDLIVGGHEHVAIRDQVGSTWISKADADAKTVERIDIDRAADGTFAFRHSLVALDGSIALDAGVDAAIQGWVAKLAKVVKERTNDPSKKKLDEIKATTEHALDGQEPSIRGKETALGNFLADVLRDSQATDIALINGGAVRINDEIPAGGNVTNYDLEGIFYYDSPIAQFELTGNDLLELLRISAAGAHLGHGRFLQVAGVRYRYYTERLASGQPVLDASDVQVLVQGAKAYAPLDPVRLYRVATLDYIWKNGYRDGYPLFSLGNTKYAGTSPPLLNKDKQDSWREVTEKAILALPGKRITTDVDRRIQRIGEPPPEPRCPAG